MSAQVFFLVRNPRLARQAESNLLLAANALQRQRINIADSGDLEQAVRNADTLLDVRVIVFSPDNNVLADSRATTEAPPNLPRQPLTPLGQTRVLEFTDRNNKVWLYTSRNLPGNYQVMVSTLKPQSPLRSVFSDELLPPLLRAGFLALVFSLLLAFALTRWITNPLHRLANAAIKLSEGKSQPVNPEGPEEIKSLAATFNQMSEKVRASQQSQRDFFANISHELRTPLTSIQGFAQAILDGTAKETSDLKQSAQIIFDESGRMRRLVSDLLELARLDNSHFLTDSTDIDVPELLTDVVTKFGPQAKAAGIDLMAGNLAPSTVKGDRDALIQVFSNLVDNAINHSAPGGKVEITANHQNQTVRITVVDNGPGIPPEETKRIFERFYKVDKSRQAVMQSGTGLGLSIAQQILHAHGGRIEVSSQPGKGSQFTVAIPSTTGA